MENLRDRIRGVIETRNPLRRFKEMEELCGFSAATWRNIFHGHQKANEDHLEAIFKAFPQYHLWLCGGQTDEARGQTSPILERIQRDLKTVGRAG